MIGYDVRVDGQHVDGTDDWRLEMADGSGTIGRLVNGERSVPVVVEGAGTDWTVTVAGRRIGVTVRSWRERVLADAERAAAAHAGPMEVRATLPGLIVAVPVSAGDEVDAGDTLVTIEAMKMQNDVRAPRAGRVIEVSVQPGQPVATGAPLVRLE